MRMTSYLFISCLISLFFSCSETSVAENEVAVKNEKICGLSFVASNRALVEQDFEPVSMTNANHLALMPFGYMKSKTDPKLIFDDDFQWWGEKSEGLSLSIDLAHKNGFKVMLKPQIWVMGGTFTGHLEMSNEEAWTNFEEDYRAFILNFAKIADRKGVDIFCIGTELGKFVAARPKFWDGLIQEIRLIYKGKLTYAENWDCYDEPAFLSQLDYIGVDAYFPISKKGESK